MAHNITSRADGTIGQQEPLFTRRQETILIMIPYFSAPISMICSSVIVYMILSDRKQKLKDIYHRLLLTMSLLDIIHSMNMSLSGLIIPPEYGRFGGHGNIATCEMNGFLLQVGVCGALFNLSLCIYCTLIIVYQWTPQRIKKSRFELLAFGVSIGYPMIFASIGLALDSFNPMLSLPGWCGFSETPYQCNLQEELDCIRGKNYFYVELPGLVIPVFVSFIGVIISMIVILRKVRRQESLMESRYSISRDITPSSTWSFNTTSRGGMMPQHSVTNGERTRQASIQAALYTAAFLLTALMPIVQSFTGAFLPNDSPKYQTIFFATGVMVVLLSPLQGFWNMIIYIRPRFARIRALNPALSTFNVCILAASGKSIQRQGSRARNDDRRPESKNEDVFSSDSFAVPNHDQHDSRASDSIPERLTSFGRLSSDECLQSIDEAGESLEGEMSHRSHSTTEQQNI